MKFKKIVGFGDSWVFGDELLDPEYAKINDRAHSGDTQNKLYRDRYCYLGLLGQHYGVPIENYGIPGGSLDSTVWTFFNWFNQTPDPQNSLILIGLTEADRFSHWNPQGHNEERKMIHSTWAEYGASEVPEEFFTMIKQQIVLTTCEKLSSLNYQRTVTMFDGIAARNHLNLFQHHIASPPCLIKNVPSVLHPDFALTKWFVQELQADHGRKYIKENGHPNEVGHELIRDLLIPWLDSCTMYEC
jgi:hypothetical protein